MLDFLVVDLTAQVIGKIIPHFKETIKSSFLQQISGSDSVYILVRSIVLLCEIDSMSYRDKHIH
jgi:hypothetical protein